VIERVTEGINHLYACYADKMVALVAHGFVAKVARAVAQAGFDDFFEWQLVNGAVCELTLTTRLPPFQAPHFKV
jgi:broad specificity phosphatase PhoE